MFGSDGSTMTSPHPTIDWWDEALNTFFQVFPASVVLYSPRSFPGVQRSPITATHAVLESVGCTAILAIVLLFGRPIFFQLPPPSLERYTPFPQLELFRSFASPVPTHTYFVFEGQIAIAPTAAT